MAVNMAWKTSRTRSLFCQPPGYWLGVNITTYVKKAKPIFNLKYFSTLIKRSSFFGHLTWLIFVGEINSRAVNSSLGAVASAISFRSPRTTTLTTASTTTTTTNGTLTTNGAVMLEMSPPKLGKLNQAFSVV